MLIEALVFPLILGKLRGGKIKNILNLEIKYWWLFTLAGLIEFSASFIRAKEIEPIWRLVDQHILWIQLVTYCMLFIVLFIHLKDKGVVFILIGTVMNFVVIMANHGRMPVDIHAIEHLISVESLNYLKSGKDLTHTLANDSTSLRFLGDIIHLKKPYPLQKSISFGDIFLVVGIFWYIYNGLMGKINKND